MSTPSFTMSIPGAASANDTVQTKDSEDSSKDYSAVREARARMKHANEMARSKGRPDSFPPEKQ